MNTSKEKRCIRCSEYITRSERYITAKLGVRVMHIACPIFQGTGTKVYR
jgi:hypothetical protein